MRRCGICRKRFTSRYAGQKLCPACLARKRSEKTIKEEHKAADAYQEYAEAINPNYMSKKP